MAKVEEYAARVKPVSINDLAMQHVLQDRRKVFRLLRENGIPLPGATAHARTRKALLFCFIGDTLTRTALLLAMLVVHPMHNVVMFVSI